MGFVLVNCGVVCFRCLFIILVWFAFVVVLVLRAAVGCCFSSLFAYCLLLFDCLGFAVWLLVVLLGYLMVFAGVLVLVGWCCVVLGWLGCWCWC